MKRKTAKLILLAILAIDILFVLVMCATAVPKPNTNPPLIILIECSLLLFALGVRCIVIDFLSLFEE